ncbi:putative serine/threonine protein kinase MRK1 PWA37_001293 [Arxiozyma heterogenica]|uniref:non-specific serine/threonine protein kinase n=1 Tax=Arxiozyma heterogenica TaxID=278026 RepID=A0AAN7WSC1_9SACH|nr:hypothetical protein RI543_003737 [Kazachstania heterogenica]
MNIQYTSPEIVYKQVYRGHPGLENNSYSNNNSNSNNNNSGIENNATEPHSKQAPESIQISFPTTEVIGHGSFGVVFTTTIRETNESVAIKKVLQDKRFKNRELEIMQQLIHPNIIDLKYFFYEKDDQGEVYLNLILDYMPQSLYQRLRHFVHQKTLMPRLEIKFYMYQLFKSLNYLHNYAKVCHRDIKPQNLLVNPQNWCLKLCDFGSAKKLSPKEPNVSYICSRYYRAPELIFGATNYTNQIDLWSSGCVMAELLLGQPMFPGESGIDQLVEIIKILGTPTKQEICSMNPNYAEHKFPQIKAIPLYKVFKKEDEYTIDLLANILKYNPNERFDPLQCLCAPYFDELRFTDGGTKINEMISELKLLDFNSITELGYLNEEELIVAKQKLTPRQMAGKE